MLLVDYREGSAELLKPLQRMGLPAESGDIPADLAWEGRGERGATVQVGVEFKKIGELVQSLRTDRLVGHQLLKMRDNFDFCYLLIEGDLLYDDRTGRLLKRSGRRQFRPLPGGMVAQELLKRLHVLHLRGGLNPIWGSKRADTYQHIQALYRTWTDCDLDQHKSHLAIYQAPTLIPISEFRGFFTRIDGIGTKVSLAVERHFGGNIRKAVNAPQSEWLKIEGIGDKLAQHINDVMEGRAKK